jgi:predicted AlkP superfamily phosphohydrolase/phosphomutase
MLWRHADEEHPFHDPAFEDRSTAHWSHRDGSTWKDVVHDLYLKMDPVLGRLRERLGDDGATLIVMSDHGFAPWHRKFSLNTWLYDNGYLVLKDGYAKELPEEDSEHREIYLALAADWSKTRAYGIGFNGLYLNLAGREKDDPKTPEDESGIVQPGAEAEALIDELKAGLEAVVDPQTGERVVLRCDKASDVYVGERVAEAPDLVVGYNSGYGNSDPSTLGRVPHAQLEDNVGGTFNGNHLMAPEVVSGVLLSNVPVRAGDHRLQDLTIEILGRYGIEKGPGMEGHRVLEDLE